MTITRRGLLGTAAAASTLPLVRARAAATPTLKIGVLNDQSGPYKDLSGLGSVVCVKQAIQDFGPKGFNVEVITADHQNKPDIGAGIARQWIDREGVTLIDSVNTSSVALAVNNVCREKNVAYLNTGAGTDDLTGKQCTPVTLHWSYDIYMLAKSTGGKTVETGGKTWYFVTANYTFGQQLQQVTTGFITAAGGKVLGASPYPFPATTDFSSFLLSAQASGAKVLGLANAGADTVNCIKQAAEFGLPRKMTIAALLMFIQDVHGVGLQQAQGLYLTESFYWNMNDATRAWTKKVHPKMPKGLMPNMTQAGDYSGTLHYLKAANATGAARAQKDGAAVVAQMKKMPTDDECFGKNHVRADGLFITDSFLFRVKKPSESKMAWDYYDLVGTTPGKEAFEPPDPACKLNQKS